MRKLIFLFSLAAGCGGAATGTSPDDTVEQPIQGGARDTGDPAVGLVWFTGGGFCSGSLIAPDVVLTAGHCVEDPVASFYTGAGEAATSVGALPLGKLTKHSVIDQIAYPSYRSENSCPNTTFDVGLLRLSKPIAGVTPLALGTSPPKAGASCRAVGYGVHDDGTEVTAEQKRRATESVEKVARTAILVDEGTGIVDHGDSGGPLLCDSRIAGTTSCGTDPAPDHDEAYYARTDTIRDWIASTVAAWR
jgi:Trypsin